MIYMLGTLNEKYKYTLSQETSVFNIKYYNWSSAQFNALDQLMEFNGT